MIQGNSMTNTLKPLDEPYSDEVAAILSKFPQRNGYILKLFRLFANSSRFLKKGVIDLLDKESPLSMRQREIVILRVTANLNCEYEWGVHITAFAAHVNLSEEQIHATKLGQPDASCWEDEETTLLMVVDDLCQGAKITTQTYQQFSAQFTKEQQLEVMALCGNYHTVSFVANSANLEGEAFGASFPKQ
jgi:alkylhydroperoxidase family enzyme